MSDDLQCLKNRIMFFLKSCMLENVLELLTVDCETRDDVRLQSCQLNSSYLPFFRLLIELVSSFVCTMCE